MNKNYFSMLVVILLASCSMEKQLYSKGFHVEWNLNSKSEIVKTDTINIENKVDRQKKLANTISIKKITKHLKNSENIVKVEDKKHESLTDNYKTNTKISYKILNSHNLSIKEINKEDLKERKLTFKETKSKSFIPKTPKRKVHILTKLGLILLGIGLILLIVGFWTWYFALISAIGGTATVVTGTSLYSTFFMAGLINLFAGLALLIVRWIFS
jgi:hypothetical protein